MTIASTKATLTELSVVEDLDEEEEEEGTPATCVEATFKHGEHTTHRLTLSVADARSLGSGIGSEYELVVRKPEAAADDTEWNAAARAAAFRLLLKLAEPTRMPSGDTTAFILMHHLVHSSGKLTELGEMFVQRIAPELVRFAIDPNGVGELDVPRGEL